LQKIGIERCSAAAPDRLNDQPRKSKHPAAQDFAGNMVRARPLPPAVSFGRQEPVL